MHRSDADPCGQPQLNFDVLVRLVCNYTTDVADVLSFALTCSTSTEDALRRRLRMSHITLDLSNAQLVSGFHAFIFSNKPARAPHIYGLKLRRPYSNSVKRMDPALSHLIDVHLVEILQAAVHIRYLHFPTSISDSVFSAVMKMTTLREIHAICQALHRPLHICLSTLWSPLRSLSVEKSARVGDNLSASFLHDHLSHFAPTLEAVNLDHFEPDIIPSSITTRFIAVRSLKFQTDFVPDWADSNILAILLRLFPNLDGTLTLGFSSSNLQEVRAQSEEAQRAYTWPGLDLLVCNAEVAFALGLRCPIRRMDIRVPWPPSRSEQYLADTIRLNSPQHLHLFVSFRRGVGITLHGLVPPEAADRLTHLVLFADFEVRYKWRAPPKRRKSVNWDRFFDRVLDALKHLRLTRLRVFFHCSVYQAVPDAFNSSEALANTAPGVDLHPVAGRFMAAMPTLEYLFLTACGNVNAVQMRKTGRVREFQEPFAWISSNAWRRAVHDHRDANRFLSESNATSEVPVWTELSSDEANSVMVREELHLSRRKR